MSGSRVRAQVHFAQIPEWVLYARGLSAQAVRVYGVLLRIADKSSRYARARHTTIAKKAGDVHPSTVKRAIAELVALGALEVTERIDDQGQHANEYLVRVVPLEQQASLLEDEEDDDTPSDLGGPRVVHPQVTGEPPSRGDPGPQTTGGPQNERPSVREKTSPSAKSPGRRSEQPTGDSIYLAEEINEHWSATKGRLTPAVCQRFVTRFGARAVEDAIRELHGFPPAEAVRSPYAYLEAILLERQAEVRSLEEQRQDRDAAAELAAHARIAVESAGEPAREETA